MRSRDEIQEELDWFEDWPVTDEIDAPCTTKFENDGYLDGLRYALGETEGRESLPSPDMINTLLDRIREEYPTAEVRVERGGFPPQLLQISVRVRIEIDEVEDYQRITETIREYAREIEEEYESEKMIYTHIEPKRD